MARARRSTSTANRLAQYVDAFLSGADSLQAIKLMDDDDLQAMGIGKRMHRKLILRRHRKPEVCVCRLTSRGGAADFRFGVARFRVAQRGLDIAFCREGFDCLESFVTSPVRKTSKSTA